MVVGCGGLLGWLVGVVVVIGDCGGDWGLWW